MSDLSAFPITRRWPAAHPDRLQLYSLNTPNGVKASIMLEETGLPYEAHLIDITANETWTPEFLSLNPNGKIPAILDPDGPGGKPLALFESGAILVYLAEKTGEFLPADPALRYETIQWVLGVLDQRLEGRDWVMGDEYTIADIATLGWVRNLIGFYEAGDLVGYADFKNVDAWLQRGLARPAVQRGLEIPKRA